ncbi:MAG: D-alanyl-D-alanine carboxypeptidase [Oscillospiraceae bacterium]|nr:D-alanyl-D-alanine carboxypeptidase [Oscillospiraceae bacterium]
MKRILALILGGLLLLQLVIPALAVETDLDISSKSCLLMERETGTVLYEENAHEQLEPASVTKIMTMLLVMEAIEDGSLKLDDVVTTSAYAAGMGGSQVFLEEGEQMTVDEMLKAVAVASGNDAAVALAEHLRGSESVFVEDMNRKAQELGMLDTTFKNCTGLPEEGHVTSAYDIALMSQALLKHDTIRDYTGIWMDELRNGEFQLANTNKLIYYYDGATGLKTGSTNAAGYCISATALRDDMELIAVILGAETSDKRFNDAKTLLNYGFGGWAVTDQTPEGLLPAIPVRLGQSETVQPILEESVRLLLKKEAVSSVQTELLLEEELEAPVNKGDQVGTFVVYVGETEAGSYPVIAGQTVERRSFWDIFLELMGAVLPKL